MARFGLDTYGYSLSQDQATYEAAFLKLRQDCNCLSHALPGLGAALVTSRQQVPQFEASTPTYISIPIISNTLYIEKKNHQLIRKADNILTILLFYLPEMRDIGCKEQQREKTRKVEMEELVGQPFPQTEHYSLALTVSIVRRGDMKFIYMGEN